MTLFAVQSKVVFGTKELNQKVENENKIQIQPPGFYIRQLLEEKGWSGTDLATILGWPQSDVSSLLSRKKKLTPEVAVQLAAIFPQTSAQYWIDLEGKFLVSQVQDHSRDVALSRRSQIFHNFPTLEMIKRGWIEKTDDVAELEKQVMTFFDISSLDERPVLNHAARKSSDYTDFKNEQLAWIKRAKQLAPAVMVKTKFSTKTLEDAMDKLRTLLFNVEDIRHIPKILADAGIRLLIVQPLPSSKIDGLTFWLDNDSPVIVLSLRFDRIDSFWHTLLHELSHVKNREGQDTPIIDVDLLSEDAPKTDRPEIEKRADRDAAAFSIPSNKLDSFIMRAHPTYSEAKIMGFAALNQVHPGIAVGQLHHRFIETGKGFPFTHHRKFLVKVKQIVTDSTLTDGYGYQPLI